jgi:hypothetical protein
MNLKDIFVTTITTLATLALALTVEDADAFNEQNNAFVINGHNHSNCQAGSCSSNEGSVFNGQNFEGQTVHTNVNTNTNRPETFKSNSFTVPGNENHGNK